MILSMLCVKGMARRGLVIYEFSIVSFNFSKTFDEAIEAKTTAEQLKMKAERDLQRIEVEAQQKIARARAEAESLSLQPVSYTHLTLPTIYSV